MREIVSLHVGSVGAHLGAEFWETISAEHGIDPSGAFQGDSDRLEGLDVYFNNAEGDKYVPRAVLVDLHPEGAEPLRARSLGQLFPPDTFVLGQAGTNSNYAKGFYSQGPVLIDAALEAVRKQAESCEHLEGLQLTHALGGGTGSGLGSLLIDRLREEFQDRIITTFTAWPSGKLSNSAVEPYNAMLSVPHLVDNTHATYCFDTEALFNICQRSLGISEPSLSDLNRLMATTMSGVTTSLRFPQQSSTTLRKQVSNLVPFARLHFFMPGLAPPTILASDQHRTLTTPELVQQAFDHRNILTECDNLRVLLAASVSFRGPVSISEGEELIRQLQSKSAGSFVDWIPDSVSTAASLIPIRGCDASATLVANSTSITGMFKRLHESFRVLYEGRNFLHWYTDEGIDETELVEAMRSLTDLSAMYEESSVSC